MSKKLSKRVKKKATKKINLSKPQQKIMKLLKSGAMIFHVNNPDKTSKILAAQEINGKLNLNNSQETRVDMKTVKALKNAGLIEEGVTFGTDANNCAVQYKLKVA